MKTASDKDWLREEWEGFATARVCFCVLWILLSERERERGRRVEMWSETGLGLRAAFLEDDEESFFLDGSRRRGMGEGRAVIVCGEVYFKYWCYQIMYCHVKCESFSNDHKLDWLFNQGCCGLFLCYISLYKISINNNIILSFIRSPYETIFHISHIHNYQNMSDHEVALRSVQMNWSFC